jgi:hypothetical protein
MERGVPPKTVKRNDLLVGCDEAEENAGFPFFVPFALMGAVK